MEGMPHTTTRGTGNKHTSSKTQYDAIPKFVTTARCKQIRQSDSDVLT